uniref:INO80 complex subunit D-B n=2 Tax=Lygus hesperus TaxID=30085 RepID=A0A146L6T7_LYGHE
MQDAFIRDMFSISDLSNPRYNGHVQVSSLGKSAGGKRDRKGCTKGKIEAIMKNNPSRPKFCLTSPARKLTAPVGNNQVFFANHTIKAEESEDPYTFAEPEPQAPSVYQHQQHQPVTAPATKKASTSTNKTFNMVCIDKSRLEPGRVLVKTVKTEPAPKAPKAVVETAKKGSGGSKRKRVESTSHKKSNDHPPSAKRDPNNIVIPAKREPRKSTWQRERNAKHELLERIHSLQNDMNQYKRDLYPLGVEVSDSESDEADGSRSIYERDWSTKIGNGSNEGLPREQRVEATRAQLRRRLAQTLRGLKVAEEPSTSLLSAVVAAARKFPNATAAILDPTLAKKSPPVKEGARFLMTGEKCSYADCQMQALPCTRHCFRHIMYNVDQRLFSHCTSRGLDNMQCNRPTFDIRHDPPLCSLHALHHEPTSHSGSDHRHSKKVSKKSRVLGVSRTKKNNKKRKKPSPPVLPPPLPPVLVPPSPSSSRRMELPMLSDAMAPPSSSLDAIGSLMPPPTLIEQANLHSLQSHVVSEDIVEEVPEEVLAIANLDPAELANQAARLLEDPDLHILNQISTDAFNDLFTGFSDKNGEYEPTREETEELERALEAVDNDVRSLERMSRSLPPLPLLNLPLDTMSLLDDPSVSNPFTPFQNGLSTSDMPHS